MNRAWVAIFLCFALSACPRPATFGNKGPLSEPEVLARNRTAEARVQGVKGTAKLHVDSPQGKGTVDLFVAAASPSRVHLETVDFFGKPQAVFVSDGDRFGLYQANEGRFYRGPATAQNLARFLPVVLRARELVALLLGQAPRLPDPAPTFAADTNAGRYTLTLHADERTETLGIDPGTFRTLDFRLEGPGAVQVEFQDFIDVGGLHFPRRMALQRKEDGASLDLRYTEVTLNPPPDDSLYELTGPEGVPVVDVDEQGQPVTPR